MGNLFGDFYELSLHYVINNAVTNMLVYVNVGQMSVKMGWIDFWLNLN